MSDKSDIWAGEYPGWTVGAIAKELIQWCQNESFPTKQLQMDDLKDNKLRSVNQCSNLINVSENTNINLINCDSI